MIIACVNRARKGKNKTEVSHSITLRLCVLRAHIRNQCFRPGEKRRERERRGNGWLVGWMDGLNHRCFYMLASNSAEKPSKCLERSAGFVGNPRRRWTLSLTGWEAWHLKHVYGGKIDHLNKRFKLKACHKSKYRQPGSQAEKALCGGLWAGLERAQNRG